jgi:hypothetical protein
LILIAGRAHLLGRLRGATIALIAFGVAANFAGSLAVSFNDSGEQRQDREISALIEYTDGQRETAPILGLACSEWAPCLQGAWLLADRGLGPFSDYDTEAGGWRTEFRRTMFGAYESLTDEGKQRMCSRVVGVTAAQRETELLSDRSGSLGSMLMAKAVTVEPANLVEATEILRRGLETECRADELRREASRAGD